jgi:uncharacterized membrane protein YphA (DoxX/SURF4 family)
MRTNPFTDTFLFLIGQTPDHDGSGVRYLLVALFWALAIAGIVIAKRNWDADPSQRTREHVATWFMRTLIGYMWFQGSLWKLPLPISGGFKYWTEEMANYAAFGLHRTLVTNVYLPLLGLINPIIFMTELSLGAAFILGFAVRPMAALGILFVVHLWLGLYQHPHEWPWQYVFLMFTQGMFLVHNAGRSLGLDALLHREPAGPFAGTGQLARFYRQYT